MGHLESEALALRLKQRLGKTQQMQHKNSKAVPGLLAVIGLAGLAACSQPAPVAFVPPPPPPVGHTFQVMVQVPPPVRHIRITAAQQQELQQAFNVIALKSAYSDRTACDGRLFQTQQRLLRPVQGRHLRNLARQ
jgi:hypothetical protein